MLSKKRFEYEQEVQRAPLSYDAWFDYIRLEEAGGDPDKIRDVSPSVDMAALCAPCPSLFAHCCILNPATF